MVTLATTSHVHARSAATTQPARTRASVLRMGVAQRFALVAGGVAAIWMAIALVLA